VSRVALEVKDLTTAHIAELRAIRADTRTLVKPQRMMLYRRLGLAEWNEPPRTPGGDGRHAPLIRAKKLTGRGVELIEMSPPDPVKLPREQRREPWGQTWVSSGMAKGASR
jgi:hypothetical protein